MFDGLRLIERTTNPSVLVPSCAAIAAVITAINSKSSVSSDTGAVSTTTGFVSCVGALSFLLNLSKIAGIYFIKLITNAKKINTNADRAIGEEVLVLERINNLYQTGRVIVHGQEWTARSENDNISFEQGELAQVINIAGVKLIVKKYED